MLDKASNLLDPKVNSFLSKKPSWLIRWGMLTFFISVVVIFLISWSIKYPDVIHAPFVLSSKNKPKIVSVKNNARLAKLLIMNNEWVESGTILGYLESTASHEDVLDLHSELINLKSEVAKDSNVNLDSLRQYELGELQEVYQIFNKSKSEYLGYRNSFYFRKTKSLRNELDNLVKLRFAMNNRVSLVREDLKIAEFQFSIQTKLFSEKVIAFTDYKKEESILLQKKIVLQNLEIEILNTYDIYSRKELEIIDIEEDLNQRRISFIESLNTLISKIEEWKSVYLLTSSIDGYVQFNDFLQDNQLLKSGDNIFTIYNSGASTKWFGELKITQDDFGRVEVGQNIIIRLNSFPFEKFGILYGRISSISQVPLSDGTFLAQVDLHQGFKTSYGINITPKVGATANALIITSDDRLLEKIVFTLRRATVR